jgi:hypothetical protein
MMPDEPALGAVKPLIAALASADESARSAAAQELVQIGGAAVEPLVECLRYTADHKGAGDMACWALGEIGDPRGIRTLIGALASAEPGVGPSASKALVRIGSPAVDLLIGALQNPNAEVRAGATTALETIADPRAIEPLKAARARWGAPSAPAVDAPTQAPAPLTESLGRDLSSAIEDATRARDRANAEEWARRGSAGAGQTHSCAMCKTTTYGEETVVAMQQQAVFVRHSPQEAEQIERKSGYRCKNCGREYCKDCLEKKAPSNAYGGKSCPSCHGLFEIIHG